MRPSIRNCTSQLRTSRRQLQSTLPSTDQPNSARSVGVTTLSSFHVSSSSSSSSSSASSSCVFSFPRRWFGSRFTTPSPTAPKEAPPVVFKPPRPSFDPLHSQSTATDDTPPIDPQQALNTYWPDGFVPNLIRPLPFIRQQQPTFAQATLTPASVRTGLIGRKVGMLPVWDSQGVRHACTVVEVDSQVVRVNGSMVKGKVGVVLGIGRARLKRVTKPLMVQYKQAGVHPKERLVEFRVTPDALLPVSLQLSALHFLPGQYVDVCGTSTGYGFQGVMRRWNFKGQPATHGVSVSHRSLGSTGSIQDPGRVWRNKKMPGRMGGERVTVLNLQVYKVDPVRNLLFIKGHVPGNVGGVVRVRDAVKKSWEKLGKLPPFPTWQRQDGDKEESDTRERVMEVTGPDPFAYGGT